MVTNAFRYGKGKYLTVNTGSFQFGFWFWYLKELTLKTVANDFHHHKGKLLFSGSLLM
jgi:hypothetical protein